MQLSLQPSLVFLLFLVKYSRQSARNSKTSWSAAVRSADIAAETHRLALKSGNKDDERRLAETEKDAVRREEFVLLVTTQVKARIAPKIQELTNLNKKLTDRIEELAMEHRHLKEDNQALLRRVDDLSAQLSRFNEARHSQELTSSFNSHIQDVEDRVAGLQRQIDSLPRPGNGGHARIWDSQYRSRSYTIRYRS